MGFGQLVHTHTEKRRAGLKDVVSGLVSLSTLTQRSVGRGLTLFHQAQVLHEPEVA